MTVILGRAMSSVYRMQVAQSGVAVTSGIKASQVLLYSIHRKTWMPHMNYKLTKKRYVYV